MSFLSGKDVELTVEKADGPTKWCSVRNLRPVPGNTGGVRLLIDDTLGLQRIIWRSKDIDDGPTGEKGIAAYRQMQDKLTETYGSPRASSEESGASVYTSPSQFYQCLGADGCGAYISRWNADDGEVYLRLTPGEKPDSGRLEVTYNGPEWQAMVAGRRKR